MGYGLTDVAGAISGLRSKTELPPDEALQAEFEAGLCPALLSYEKLQPSGRTLPILQKYLIGATTFLHQPCNFYDIFRVCRCVNMVQYLDAALDALTAKRCAGLETRLNRLVRETEHDRFDSVAFELITAGRYAVNPAVHAVEFLEERPPQKTPDFLVRLDAGNPHVECKKLSRAQNHTVVTRNLVRNHVAELLTSFRSRNISALADVVFHTDPAQVTPRSLVSAARAALWNQTAIIDPAFTVSASVLPPYESDGPMLYPSPLFSWKRYGYRIRSDWFGFINEHIGSSYTLMTVPPHLRGGMSSWLKEISWDAAVRWKIDSEEVLPKYQRFAFDGVFDGLAQIANSEPNSILHVWLESEYPIGGRKEPLLNLFERLRSNQTRSCGWIVINETLFDVSPKGRFDLVEHAHFIRGPSATTLEPLVSAVLCPTSESLGVGEFGAPVHPPDIDEES